MYEYDVPQEVIGDYDYLDENERFDGWIKYRNTYYHTSDFMRVDNMYGPAPFEGWHGYHNDSSFSAIVIRLSDDNEMYQIGTVL